MSTNPATPRILLYSWDGCPWAHRARIAAKAAGIPVELVTVNPGDKPPWYIPNVNPAGKVPSAWYDAPADADPTKPPKGTTIIPESSILVDFFLSLAPGKVTYGNPVLDAFSHTAAYRLGEEIQPHWGKLSRLGQSEAKDSFLSAVRAWVKEYLDFNDGELVKSQGFAKGEILLAPFVTRWFDLSQADAGGWNAGTGPEVYEVLSTDPELENLRLLYQKLKGWEAYQGTHDNEDLIRKQKLAGEKKRAEKQA